MKRMLAEAGWDVVTMRDVYGRAVSEPLADEVWISEMTREGFALLTADHRISRNVLLAKAVFEAAAVMFMLPTGALTGQQQAKRYIRNGERIHVLASRPGPAVFAVYERIVSAVPLAYPPED